MTHTHRTLKEKKEDLLKALELCDGLVSVACEEAKVARKSFYNWRNKDKKFAQSVREVAEVVIDAVESQLFKNIRKGREISTIFYLKTKAKHRGYIEKQEVDHSTLGQPIVGATINIILAPKNADKPQLESSIPIDLEQSEASFSA